MKTKIKKLWNTIKTFTLITIIISIGVTSVISYNAYMEVRSKLAPVEIKLIEPTIPVFEEINVSEEHTGTPDGYEVAFERTMEVSAYTASVEETDSSPTITANGDTVYVGGSACPRNWKFGTKVMIDDVVYTCNDRMARRYTNNVDIYMEEKSDALAWGRQSKDVVIYKKM